MFNISFLFWYIYIYFFSLISWLSFHSKINYDLITTEIRIKVHIRVVLSAKLGFSCKIFSKICSRFLDLLRKIETSLFSYISLSLATFPRHNLGQISFTQDSL